MQHILLGWLPYPEINLTEEKRHSIFKHSSAKMAIEQSFLESQIPNIT